MKEISGNQIVCVENKIFIFTKLNVDNNWCDNLKINISSYNLELLSKEIDWSDLFVTTINYSPSQKTQQFVLSRVSRKMFDSLKIAKGKSKNQKRLMITDTGIEFKKKHFSDLVGSYVQLPKNQKSLKKILSRLEERAA